MIIYGTNSAHLGTIQSQTTCSECNQKGSTIISLFRRHAHIFWIPLFPIGKVGASECQHCKVVYKPKQMPRDLNTEYQELKEITRGPLWQFAGLVIIAGLVLTLTISDMLNDQNTKAFMEAPQTGDTYRYKLAAGSYSSFKILEVSPDSLLISHNLYETNKISGMNEIEKDENYADEIYSISRETVREMYEDKDIFTINRE